MSSFIRRFFRLLLPLWGFMLVFTIWYAIWPNEEYAKGQGSIMDFLYAITFLLTFTGWTRGIPGPAWTLPLEIFGSNLVYLLTAIMIPMHKNPRAKYIMLTVMMIFNWLGQNWMNYFIAGLMLADMRTHGYLAQFQQWKYAHVTKFLLLVFTAPFAFTYFNNPIRPWFEYVLSDVIRLNVAAGGNQWGFPNAGVLFPFIFATMFIMETTPWFQRILSWSPFLFLGKISYMLYLSHQMVGRILDPVYDSFINNEKVPRWVSLPISWTSLMAIDILVGWILTYIFDTPALNFIKYWEAVFLMEDKWSWDLVFDWSKGKFKRTVEDVKAKVVLIRKAPARRWIRARKRRAQGAENVVAEAPVPVEDVNVDGQDKRAVNGE
ncbi:hypothetical protein HDV05_004880 [Chytridiales sp. JEL 0842]|nr:hypothetical protein HDV05_004880 [Chytridiales sp. JEL 0842]